MDTGRLTVNLFDDRTTNHCFLALNDVVTEHFFHGESCIIMVQFQREVP